MTLLAQTALVLGVMLVSAKLAEELFRRIGLPGFVGAVVVGIVLSPACLGVLKGGGEEYLVLFTTLGINFLLFIAGAEELREIELAGGIRWLLVGGVLLFTASTATVALAMAYLGYGLDVSLLVGGIMGAVSVGPMVRALMESGLIATPAGRMAVLVGVVAELAAIFFFNASVRGWSPMVFVYAALVLAAFYVFGRFLFIRILHVVESRISVLEAPFAVLVALILTVGYMAELTGLTAALMSLGLGIFSATYLEERPDLMEKLKALTHGFFEPLFFAGIGLYVHYVTPSMLGWALLLAVLASVPKVIIGYRLLGSMTMGLLTLSKGGVDMALLLTALYMGLIGSELYDVVLLSTLMVVLVFALPLRGRIASLRRMRARLSVRDVCELGVGRDVVRLGAPLTAVLGDLVRRGALVVVDDHDHPVGVVLASDLVTLNPEEFPGLRVEQVMKEEAPKVRLDEPVSSILERQLDVYPVIAVVDESGRVAYTLHYSDLLRCLHELSRRRRGGRAG